MNRSVWITGAGVVSALGSGIDTHRTAIIDSCTGLSRQSFFGGAVPDPCMCGMVPQHVLGCTLEQSAGDRANRLLNHALSQAIEGAGLIRGEITADIIAGNTSGNMHGASRYYQARRRNEPADLSLVRTVLPCSAVSDAARSFGITGRRTTVSSACGSSLASLGYAFERISRGECDMVIAGGFEALSPYVVAGFNSLRLVSSRECRPFDRDRDGLNPGEAAAVLVLESADAARRRGAAPLAAVTGFGESLEAYHHTRSHPEGLGLVRAMTTALNAASLTPGDIAHLHLHGTATQANDLSEFHACRTVFSDRLPHLPACSTKSRTGHTFGAAGALNTVFTIISMKTGFIPATMFHENLDPGFAGLSVSSQARQAGPLRHAMTTALGFGGESFALILSHAEGA